jgi:hypothetical protein
MFYVFYVQVKLSVAGVSQKNKNYPLFRPSVPDLNQGSDTNCNDSNLIITTIKLEYHSKI